MPKSPVFDGVFVLARMLLICYCNNATHKQTTERKNKMDEFISSFKQWIADMKENPEIIGSEFANVGGKIVRGVAAVAGGAVEAVGSVGAAAVDITASSIGAESVSEEAAKAIR